MGKDLDWKLWIDKNFRYTKDVMTSKNNIAYTNIKVPSSSKWGKEEVNKNGKYELGEILIFNMQGLQKGRRG